MYLNTYIAAWGSTEPVSTGTSYSNNKNASLECSSGKNVAWEAKKVSNNKYVILHKRNTSSNWNFTPKLFEPSGSEKYYRPSITTHSGTQRSIVWYSDYGVLYRSYFNGSTWSTMGWADTYLQHPNLSAGTATAKYVFTGGSASPYQIYLSNETLPLVSLARPMLASVEEEQLKMLPCPQHYHRAAVIEDTTSSSLLWVQWGDIKIRTKNNTDVPMSFVALPDSMPQLTAETVFNYLTAGSLVLPADSDSLEWEQELYGCGLGRLVPSGTSNLVLETKLVETQTGLPLAVLNRVTLPVSLAELRLTGTVLSDISAYQGREVMLRVNVIAIAQNIFGITANVGEVFIIENPFLNISQPKVQPPVAAEPPLPVVYQLEQNYPNPFNATTTLRYQLPQASQVTLKIYNLLSQQVRTLVDKDQAAGYHTVQWDGRDDMGTVVVSGVYLYVIQAGEFIDNSKMVVLR